MSDYGVDLSGPLFLFCIVIIGLVTCLWVWAPWAMAVAATVTVGLPSAFGLLYVIYWWLSR